MKCLPTLARRTSLTGFPRRSSGDRVFASPGELTMSRFHPDGLTCGRAAYISAMLLRLRPKPPEGLPTIKAGTPCRKRTSRICCARQPLSEVAGLHECPRRSLIKVR
jgi:hypothetical protein